MVLILRALKSFIAMQNDQPTMLQSLDYIISQNPTLIATNPTLPTISAAQKQNDSHFHDGIATSGSCKTYRFRR
ncbi:MAG: hypothetical protein IPI62_01195 [Bacteroidetes bacterium]|nr:hypothetical protein [Bacteroidota bacterium]